MLHLSILQSAWHLPLQCSSSSSQASCQSEHADKTKTAAPQLVACLLCAGSSLVSASSTWAGSHVLWLGHLLVSGTLGIAVDLMEDASA
jgi:hypothetical protein